MIIIIYLYSFIISIFIIIVLLVAKLHLENMALPSLMEPTPMTAKGQIEYIHGIAENTKLGTGIYDMVTMSLVAHELPTIAFT